MRTAISARFLQRSEAAPRWSWKWCVTYSIGSVSATLSISQRIRIWVGARIGTHWDRSKYSGFSAQTPSAKRYGTMFDICRCVWINYFGGARSKGFATLKNVSKLPFFNKIGQAKSVGFRFYSAIWRSESRISSRYLEITSISLIYSLTFSRKKELLFWLPQGLSRLPYMTRRIRGDFCAVDVHLILYTG